MSLNGLQEKKFTISATFLIFFTEEHKVRKSETIGISKNFAKRKDYLEVHSFNNRSCELKETTNRSRNITRTDQNQEGSMQLNWVGYQP